MATEKTVKVSLSEFDSMRDELKSLRAENKKLRAKVAGVEKALKDEPKAGYPVTIPYPVLLRPPCPLSLILG
jgi:hypothetical protein